MSLKWNTWGVVFAITAGLFTLATTFWPAVPQGIRGELGALWGIGAFTMGFAYVISIFLAEARPALTLVILTVGAVVQGVSGVVFGRMFGGLAAFVDVFPAALALLAAATLFRSQRRADVSPEALNTERTEGRDEKAA